LEKGKRTKLKVLGDEGGKLSENLLSEREVTTTTTTTFHFRNIIY
jgi:hypothetical protein